MGAAQMFLTETVTQAELLFPLFIAQRDGFRIETLDSKQHRIIQPILRRLHTGDQPNTWVYVQPQLAFEDNVMFRSVPPERQLLRELDGSLAG